MKGQGSTEYLVIFAAVLVVALIVIFLLGQFTGFGRESLVDQSKAYWEGKKPLSIVEWTFNSDGSATLILKNNDVEKVEFENITLDGYTAGTPQNISPGGTTTVSYSAGGLRTCTEGEIVEYQNVAIAYKKPDLSSNIFTEKGTVPLRGHCVT